MVFCAKVYSYEIKCPDFSERNLRAKGFCKRHTPDRYACLYDVNAFIPIESCDRIADYSSPGKTHTNFIVKLVLCNLLVCKKEQCLM